MKKVLSIGLAMLAFFPMCVGAKELFVDSPNGKISAVSYTHLTLPTNA